MENYDVKRLALVLAIQAEIEGMKAANQTYVSSVYKEDAFKQKAEFKKHGFVLIKQKHNDKKLDALFKIQKLVKDV